MDRHEPGLAELRPPNPQDPFLQIHVLPVERQRFADAQAGDREQSEDRRERVALQPRGGREPACRVRTSPSISASL